MQHRCTSSLQSLKRHIVRAKVRVRADAVQERPLAILADRDERGRGRSARVSLEQVRVAPGPQRSSTLTLDSMAYTTNYQTQSDYTDQNGNTIAAGSYIICDNLSTQMYVDLAWTGGLKNLYVQFKGLSTGSTKTVPFYAFSGVDYSGSGTATYTPASVRRTPRAATSCSSCWAPRSPCSASRFAAGDAATSTHGNVSAWSASSRSTSCYACSLCS